MGLTVVLGRFSSLFMRLSSALFVWGRLLFGGGSVPIYTCAGRELGSLITHSSRVAPMGAWGGPVMLGD